MGYFNSLQTVVSIDKINYFLAEITGYDCSRFGYTYYQLNKYTVACGTSSNISKYSLYNSSGYNKYFSNILNCQYQEGPICHRCSDQYTLGLNRCINAYRGLFNKVVKYWKVQNTKNTSNNVSDVIPTQDEILIDTLSNMTKNDITNTDN